MNKQVLISVGVLILVAVGSWFFFLRGGKSKTEENKTKQVEVVRREEPKAEVKVEEKAVEEGAVIPTEEAEEGPAESENVAEDAEEEVEVFEMTGKNFEFSLTALEVKEGQKVRIVFTSEEGFHDWVVDEFNAATAQVSTGETSSVEFVADQVGEFEFYCSVGNHREMGMVGTLTVTAPEVEP